MARYFVAALVALVALQGCIAKPADKSQLEVLADNAKHLADDITNTLGIKDITGDKIKNTLTEQANALSANLNTLKSTIDKEINAHKGEVNQNLKDFEAKLSSVVEDIRKVVDPEKKATNKVGEISTQLEAGLKRTAEEFDKLVKTAQPGAQEARDNFQKFTKNLLDSFLETGKDIQTKVNKAIADHEKTHTH